VAAEKAKIKLLEAGVFDTGEAEPHVRQAFHLVRHLRAVIPGRQPPPVEVYRPAVAEYCRLVGREDMVDGLVREVASKWRRVRFPVGVRIADSVQEVSKPRFGA
jgi:hypothetical protein